MGKETKIEYCDSTCNAAPFCSGCELYSPEPDKNHCYAATLCRRYAGKRGWPETFTTPTYFPERIEQALRWPDLTGTERPDKPWLNGYPRIIFLNDLGDGFSPIADPHKWLTPHLASMEFSPHVWLFLTKWPARMVSYFSAIYRMVPDNFWLGTTITTQATVRRGYELAKLNANLWLSLEPLLEPVELPHDLVKRMCWVVAGGESGKNARPMHPSWARAVRNKVVGEGVPFFFKQWGEWLPNDQPQVRPLEGNPYPAAFWTLSDVSFRVGKKTAGRELDGQLWSQMPRMGR